MRSVIKYSTHFFFFFAFKHANRITYTLLTLDKLITHFTMIIISSIEESVNQLAIVISKYISFKNSLDKGGINELDNKNLIRNYLNRQEDLPLLKSK